MDAVIQETCGGGGEGATERGTFKMERKGTIESTKKGFVEKGLSKNWHENSGRKKRPYDEKVNQRGNLPAKKSSPQLTFSGHNGWEYSWGNPAPQYERKREGFPKKKSFESKGPKGRAYT